MISRVAGTRVVCLKWVVRLGILGAVLLPLSAGCATKTQTGLLVGGAGGAGVGAAIGSASGNAGKGALIGGVVGLIGGGLVGHAMDESDKKAEQDRRDQADRDARHYQSRTNYASSDAGGRGPRLTQDQVVAWARQGTRDDIIIDRIERADTVFRLTAADEQHLRQQGVSDDVVAAMRQTARR